ncbi:MAG TPA: YkgJ family cysteine cluster protein [Dehalococcoidales bacterium]|nr:YkgJ family cysteine cluster protein [Dehalococcoidales bacterium]
MDFSCICCGTCCRQFQPWLTPEEAIIIAGRLGMTLPNFISDFTDRRWPGVESFLLKHVGEACVFLFDSEVGQLKLCRIHSFKPASCRAWASGSHKSECQKGLKNLFGISVDSNARLQGSDHQLLQLALRHKHIKSL